MFVEPGIKTNATDWHPLQDSDHDLINDLGIEIFLDTSCLLDTKLDNKKIVCNKHIADTFDPERKNLSIRLHGFSSNAKTHNTVAIKIDVFIENLSIASLYKNHGYFVVDDSGERKPVGQFVDENGLQVIEIYTPIYVWLLQHQQLIDSV